MAQSRTDFADYRKRNVRLSAWLLVDVPGAAAERIPELQKAMRAFAKDWIAEDSTRYMGDTYAVVIGVAEAKKLRVFVQER